MNNPERYEDSHKSLEHDIPGFDLSDETLSREQLSFSKFDGICRDLFSCVLPLIEISQSSGPSFEIKADGTVVTPIDIAIEKEMRNRLARARPTDSVIGEELENTIGSSDISWTIDPIDGTESFIHGIPFYGSMIGLLENGISKYGAIFFPYTSSILISDGNVTRLDGRILNYTKQTNLFLSTLITSDLVMLQRTLNTGNLSPRFIDAVRIVRTWGDCNGYSMVCQGVADIVADVGLDITDIAPIIPICKGAGLKISGLLNEDPLQSGSILIAPPALHREVLNLLNREQSFS